MLKEYKPSEIGNIKIHGRTNDIMDPVTLFWTASGIELNIKACELKIRYRADYSVFEPWIDVIVNGERYQKRPLEKGVHEITIWRSMEQRNGQEPLVRNVKILRDTPAMPNDPYTLFQIEAIYCDGTFEEIEEPKLKMEFIGDSITSGEGGMGPFEEQDWNSSCFDCVNNYAYMTARELEADYQVYSQSGWGFCWSWYGNPAEQMPQYYDQICGVLQQGSLPGLSAHEAWKFDKFSPEIVVINLGTNDLGAFTESAHENARALNFDNTHNLDENGMIPSKEVDFMKDSVVKFLEHLREVHPKATIIWAYGMLEQEAASLNEQMVGILKGAMDEFCDKTGDSNAYYLQLPVTAPDGFGSRSHPGTPSHRNAAECLTKFIRELG